MTTTNTRVAVIGAGVAGVATAAALKAYGVDFVVYDKQSGPGGLWVNNYHGAKVQTTFELYEFPGKKYSVRSRKDHPAPTASEVCAYLQEFINEKDIASHFRFNCAIDNVVRKADSEWHVHFGDGRKETFSYCVICTGMVSGTPNLIDIPGMVKFVQAGGQVLHSSQVKTEAMFQGKKVLVIGNGKSALDMAGIAARAALENDGKPPIQLARKRSWYMPRFVWEAVQYKYVFHSRMGSSLFPCYYETTSNILKLLHVLFTPLKWIIWRLLELAILVHYRFPLRLNPTLGTLDNVAMSTTASVVDRRHLHHVRSGQIDLRYGTVQELAAGKAVLSTGQEEPVDIVVLATGWRNSHGHLDKGTVLSKLDLADDGLWLYREVLPINIPGLAFVGSNTFSFMNIYTSYVQAFWLAQMIAGKRQWPSVDTMNDNLSREKEFKRRYCGHTFRGATIAAYMQQYHDVLFKEMHARKPQRKGLARLIAPLLDAVMPVVPSTMAGTMEPEQSDTKP